MGLGFRVYDSIGWEARWEVLKLSGVHPHVINLLEGLVDTFLGRTALQSGGAMRLRQGHGGVKHFPGMCSSAIGGCHEEGSGGTALQSGGALRKVPVLATLFGTSYPSRVTWPH
eukprot:364921-Chlamydomonas_euryale.AAC.4